jgi:hypothetical protein
MTSWIDLYCQQFGYGSCASVPWSDVPIFWGGTALGFVAVIMFAFALMQRPREGRRE